MLAVLRDLVSLIFPRVCPGCNRTLLKMENSICLHCQSKLPKRLNLRTDELKQRFYGRLQLEEAHAFLLFKSKGLTQKILHSIKYNGNQELAVVMGELFGKNCAELNFFSSVDVIVPVPLHISKLRFRGFNQSALIAEGLSIGLGVNLDTISVKRTVRTSTQTKKSRIERWKNVAKIFVVVPEQLRGKNVLLVDDVITTGATLESCGQAILDAGAAKVSLACLALA